MRERRYYTAELKAEALKMIIEQGMSHQEACDLPVSAPASNGLLVNKKKEQKPPLHATTI